MKVSDDHAKNIDHVLQKDVIHQMTKKYKKNDLLTIAQFGSDDGVSIFCALALNDVLPNCLVSNTWDLRTFECLPRLYTNESGREIYEKHAAPSGIEPFVYSREFATNEVESYLELCEDFRMLFNVHIDQVSGDIQVMLSDGLLETVGKVTKDKIEIKLDLVERYAGIKGSSLVVFYQSTRKSKLSIEDVEKTSQLICHHSGDLFNMSVYVRPCDYAGPGFQSSSFLVGKFVIKGREGRKVDLLNPKPKSTQPCKFIVGVDEDGSHVEMIPPGGVDDFLRPVHFRRDVLQKYRQNSNKYSVGDGRVRCGAVWILPVDMNLSQERVAVYLGDLEQLPPEDQYHWRSHNIEPAGELISLTAFKRDFDAEFAEPTSPDLVLIHKIERLNQQWLDKYGWHLFLPLAKEDEYIYEAFHLPDNKSQVAFDEFISYLSKLLVDSLNESSIKKKHNQSS